MCRCVELPAVVVGKVRGLCLCSSLCWDHGPSDVKSGTRPPAAWDKLGAGEGGKGVGGWHKASVSDCLPLAAPIGLSPALILTLCGPERVLVVSTEPPDDLSCLTTPGVGRPRDGAVARAVDQGEGGGSCADVCLIVDQHTTRLHTGGGGFPLKTPSCFRRETRFCTVVADRENASP